MGLLVGRRGVRSTSLNETHLSRRDVLALTAVGLVAGAPGMALAAESGSQLTWAVHVSLAPTWFDPADTQGHQVVLVSTEGKPTEGKPEAQNV